MPQIVSSSNRKLIQLDRFARTTSESFRQASLQRSSRMYNSTSFPIDSPNMMMKNLISCLSVEHSHSHHTHTHVKHMRKTRLVPGWTRCNLQIESRDIPNVIPRLLNIRWIINSALPFRRGNYDRKFEKFIVDVSREDCLVRVKWMTIWFARVSLRQFMSFKILSVPRRAAWDPFLVSSFCHEEVFQLVTNATHSTA